MSETRRALAEWDADARRARDLVERAGRDSPPRDSPLGVLHALATMPPKGYRQLADAWSGLFPGTVPDAQRRAMEIARSTPHWIEMETALIMITDRAAKQAAPDWDVRDEGSKPRDFALGLVAGMSAVLALLIPEARIGREARASLWEPWQAVTGTPLPGRSTQ